MLQNQNDEKKGNRKGGLFFVLIGVSRGACARPLLSSSTDEKIRLSVRLPTPRRAQIAIGQNEQSDILYVASICATFPKSSKKGKE
jgi:hypothetical protein